MTLLCRYFLKFIHDREENPVLFMEIWNDIQSHHFFSVHNINAAVLKIHSVEKFLMDGSFRQKNISCSELVKKSFAVGGGGVGDVEVQFDDTIVDFDGVHPRHSGETEIRFIENPLP